MPKAAAAMPKAAAARKAKPKPAAPDADADADPSAALSVVAAGATYTRLDQRQHVLHRPGMYIGSVHPEAIDAWVWTPACGTLRHAEALRYVPGLHQIFLEILTNAADHAVKHRVRAIRVDIDEASGRIAVENDGPGIPADVHAETGLRVPELVFGHLLTSSNYDDRSERVVAGQNGIGAKSTNIFSTEFAVTTREGGTLYQQTWRDNMAAVGPAAIRKERGASFTRVEFVPDLARFGIDRLDSDVLAMLRRSVLDAAAMTPPHTTVHLDGAPVPVKNFRQYVELYLEGDGAAFELLGADGGDWDVAVAVSPDGVFRQVSFVNGLWTPKGGKHVEHVAAAVARRVAAKLVPGKEKDRERAAAAKAVRGLLWLFVSARVPNPSFDSQNKHLLTTPPERFRTKYEVSDAMLRAILAKTQLQERLRAASAAADLKTLKRSDGDQRRNVTGLPKLDDASLAGTRRSAECTLILTEGDSAKSTAIAGLSVVGRERFGVFPLRGKLLNVRDTGASKIGDNEEIKALKKIIGLETGRDYASDAAFATLRYGSVLMLCDQDVDGHHIKGLIINMFDVLWPGLARRPGFLRAMATPIVRARANRPNRKAADVVSFYSVPEFEAWAARGEPGWTVKYYKGLGSSTNDDARTYFADMRLARYVYRGDTEVESGQRADLAGAERPVSLRLVVVPAAAAVVTEDAPIERERVEAEIVVRAAVHRSDGDALDMAFGRARAGERKVWLNTVDPTAVLAYDGADVGIAQFVDRELSHFSRDDVWRSLPCAVDGLKKSQRKVVFAVKMRPRGAGETRVAQLAGFVGQVSGYHHGEASLQSTIVGMAQRFTGCGNVQLLRDSGQFGSRIMGGKDCASARYIHTEATPAFRALFPDADEPLLERQLDDDHNEVEPTHYLPVLPLALLNGALGIGTGYSTSVPCFSPALVADAYLHRLEGGDAAAFRQLLADPPPCYRGFRGTFVRAPDNARRWHSRGVWTRSSPKTLDIEELPVGTWTHDYKEFLEDLCAAGKHGLRRYDSRYTESDARFSLTFESAEALEALAADPDALEAALRLRSDKGLSMTNMHLIDSRDRVRCYATPADIAEEHFSVRLHGYRRRLQRQIADTARAAAVLQAKAAFVADVVEGGLETRGVPIESLVRHCRDRGWPEAPAPSRPQHPFAYIVDMPVSSLTAERRASLLAEVDDATARLRVLTQTAPEAAWAAEIREFMRQMPADDDDDRPAQMPPAAAEAGKPRARTLGTKASGKPTATAAASKAASARPSKKLRAA